MRTDGAGPFDQTAWTPERAADALRAHGCRVTRPRIAVLRALLEHGAPIEAAALTRLAGRHEPGIHEATVYRTVNVLSEVGIVSHLHAGHGPALVRLSSDDQVVAVCRHCGAIEPVPDDAVAELVRATSGATGFVLEPGHFALEGTCATCLP